MIDLLPAYEWPTLPAEYESHNQRRTPVYYGSSLRMKTNARINQDGPDLTVFVNNVDALCMIDPDNDDVVIMTYN